MSVWKLLILLNYKNSNDNKQKGLTKKYKFANALIYNCTENVKMLTKSSIWKHIAI